MAQLSFLPISRQFSQCFTINPLTILTMSLIGLINGSTFFFTNQQAVLKMFSNQSFNHSYNVSYWLSKWHNLYLPISRQFSKCFTINPLAILTMSGTTYFLTNQQAVLTMFYNQSFNHSYNVSDWLNKWHNLLFYQLAGSSQGKKSLQAGSQHTIPARNHDYRVAYFSGIHIILQTRMYITAHYSYIIPMLPDRISILALHGSKRKCQCLVLIQITWLIPKILIDTQ